MALEAGTRFGAHELVEAIGAGGMGEVYRAHDTTLERDVAIKVLPASFADDTGRVERFDREAKTLAALNHPNIAQIYGLEKADSTTALVMELVDGPTLEERIAKGPIPADEALGIAMQIADALEAAHGQNIVHRDLKPANIKLKPDGTVKVLDFGIAKALAPENLVTGPQSPIMTTPATQVGVILGTAAYMSPEQAKGKVVDQRTDIWAFGCVLYEMLTGQLAFGAEDVPTTLARIIANDTNLDTLPAAVSPAVRHTIGLCLQKDPRKRIRDIGDVKLALAGAFESVMTSTVSEIAMPRASVWRRAVPVAAAVIIAAVLGGGAVWLTSRPPPPTVTRFDYDLPDAQILRAPDWPMLTITADGSRFAYNTNDGLFVRNMDELDARLVPGTEPSLDNPAFSPDGNSVAYWDESGYLKRIAISGGAPVAICPISALFGISWAADGAIYYVQTDGIYRVAATGGMPELVIPSDADRSIYGVELLPDGDHLLFSTTATQGDWDSGVIVAQSLSTGERTVLVEGGTAARYMQTGHLVYALGDGLLAVVFDADSLTVSGGAVPLVQGITRAVNGQTGVAHYSVSANGTLVYLTGSVYQTKHSLAWVDRNGSEDSIAAPARAYVSPRLSPDGERLLLNARDDEQDIWIWHFGRQTLTRLTFGSTQERFPVWSLDGARVAYLSGLGQVSRLLWQAADGTGAPEQIAVNGGFPTAFVPGQAEILVYGGNLSNSDDIALVSLDGSDEVTPLLHTEFDETMPELSPDGRWLAYVSNESGSDQVYVRSFPDVDAGGRWQVSSGGGAEPLWSRDGRTLYYRHENAILAVSVDTDSGFVFGNAAVVIEGMFATGLGGRTYDVTADGERFLVMKDVAVSASTSRFVVVENWFEELERLVPTE